VIHQFKRGPLLERQPQQGSSTTGHGSTNDSVSGEVVLDFMFWPSSNHRFGWYLEPGYDHDFGRGHEQSLAISAGLLIAIPSSKR